MERRLLLACAALGMLATASCSPDRSASAGAAVIVAAPSPAAVEEIPLSPDVEAPSIPTVNGIPTVPLTAPVTNLEAAPTFVRHPPHRFDTNETAVELIKEEEALRLEAYELGGLWLIGYGHLMLDGEKDVITEEEAEAFLVADLAWCEGALERMIDTHVTHNEFSAVSAFCYNVGSGKTRGSSIVKRLNAEDRLGAADAFLLWNRMNGKVMSALAKRRARERTLFLTP